jgi:hypothetical protein
MVSVTADDGIVYIGIPESPKKLRPQARAGIEAVASQVDGVNDVVFSSRFIDDKYRSVNPFYHM